MHHEATAVPRNPINVQVATYGTFQNRLKIRPVRIRVAPERSSWLHETPHQTQRDGGRSRFGRQPLSPIVRGPCGLGNLGC